MHQHAPVAAESTCETTCEKWDRRLGIVTARASAAALALSGAVVALLSTEADNFTIARHWPALAAIAILWFLAFKCWNKREGLLEKFSDAPSQAAASVRRND